MREKKGEKNYDEEENEGKSEMIKWRRDKFTAASKVEALTHRWWSEGTAWKAAGGRRRSWLLASTSLRRRDSWPRDTELPTSRSSLSDNSLCVCV